MLLLESPAMTCWRTVSVAADSCLDANVATTAAIVLGRSAVEWLAGRALPARLVRACGDVVTVATAVHAEVPVATLRSMIYAYPTFHRAIEAALAEL